MLKFNAVRQQSSKISVCIDFRFNLLRNVKKVNWKKEAPWYREVHDGLNWFGYCKNRGCQAHAELFVVNRGYGIFKLEQELAEFSCPVCMQTQFDLSNMGFVNCEWALKGQLRSSSHVKIYADGQTYDQKLYTFEELNYKKEFNYLNIFVKRSESASSIHLSDIDGEPSSQSSISSPSNASQMGKQKPPGNSNKHHSDPALLRGNEERKQPRSGAAGHVLVKSQNAKNQLLSP